MKMTDEEYNLRRLERKMHRRREIRQHIKATIIGISVLIGAGIAGNNDVEAEGYSFEPQYIICDVTCTDNTNITVVMPNGEIHDYEIDELDFSVCEVCFMTHEIDNYESYKIVAIR